LDYRAGFNKKLNDGVKKATGNYLIFLHDDCEVTPDWLDDIDKCGSFQVGEWLDTMQYWGGFFHNTDIRRQRGYCQDPVLTPHYNHFCMLSKKAANKIFPLDEYFKHPWELILFWL